ncbi:F-box/kelch-repeat protein skip25 [Phtheirospermum japonicum]|uniref:F-box/kelch-repeat protein skip25 n=1 Tax=Phtheirospermum japonicum TaxID=374723 RepID=A0A830C057_9LAMI|nr:F-box/kelch-repeat protein skip25 [Phtheirospermum japonicum]
MDADKKTCKNEEPVPENEHQNPQTGPILLPGLPNHLALLCLLTLPPYLLYKVCKSWRRLIYSPDFPPYFALYAILCQIRLEGQSQSHSINLSCFDPISSKWISLPSPSFDPSLSLLRRHPSYISRILPTQSTTASGRLVLISANTDKFHPVLARPLVYDPRSNNWSLGPMLSTPRRWCITGPVRGAIYVTSGTGAQFNSEVARCNERWDVSKKETEWVWEKLAPYRDGRFSREAIEAVGYRGKLCMVNVNGTSAKEGAVYDIASDRWEDMPRGMLRGWNGPATIDAAADAMYVVDRGSGSLSKYDGDNDRWDVIIESLECLRGAEQISARGGKVSVVSDGGRRIVMVDVLVGPPRVWILDPPRGMEVIAVHVLPKPRILESEQFSG